MRAISHVGTTPAPISIGALPPKAGSNIPHRRVMRAAWTLHRTCGGTFSEALKEAWRHETARIALSATESLQDELIQSAYLCGSITELKSAFPIEDYYLYTRRSRSIIADLIERLISMLDIIDGDSDFEDDRCDMECDARHLAGLTAPKDTYLVSRKYL